jgi:hypothetical protein
MHTSVTIFAYVGIHGILVCFLSLCKWHYILFSFFTSIFFEVYLSRMLLSAQLYKIIIKNPPGDEYQGFGFFLYFFNLIILQCHVLIIVLVDI